MDQVSDLAVVGGRLFSRLEEVTDDLDVLDSRGTWIVVVPFDGSPVLARFGLSQVAPSLASLIAGARNCPSPFLASPGRARAMSPGQRTAGKWTSSLSRGQFCDRVTTIRDAIGAGDVYQVNLCRRLRTPLPPRFDLLALGAALQSGNPAPHGALVQIPSMGLSVASASPERFLSRRGDLVYSEPIKGTATEPGALTAKDVAENVMIVDLVRNDLGRVCEFGSVEVPSLCRTEIHPGLAHLVSTVAGQLRAGVSWRQLLAATFPPGSVTGAPKLAALGTIATLETVSRGLYCGAIGWVDATRQRADLNVAIRTFWVEDGHLNLGTGGGITWDSDPAAEWAETELKVNRLLQVGASSWSGPPARRSRQSTPSPSSPPPLTKQRAVS